MKKVENQATLFIIGSYAPSLLNFRLNLIRDLRDAGYTVVAMAPAGHPEVEAALRQEGVSFMAVPLSRTGLNPMGDWRTWRWLRQQIRLQRPAWVITYTVKPVIYGTWAAREIQGVRTLALITGLGYLAMPANHAKQRWVQRIMRQLYRMALRKLDVAAFQNPDDKAYMAQYGLLPRTTRQIITAGSGVDLSRYTPAQPVTSPVTFLLIARLLKSKGLEQYFDAAERLKARYGEQVEFQLIGMQDPGNPDAIDANRLEKLHAAGVIHYLGQQQDVRPFLAQCSVFVLPSYYREGTPRTILEALATGKPVVTTDNVGCRETVTEGVNGFLVPIKDSEALTTALERVVLQPALIPSMGDASLQLAKEKYDVQLVNRMLMEEMAQHA